MLKLFWSDSLLHFSIFSIFCFKASQADTTWLGLKIIKIVERIQIIANKYYVLDHINSIIKSEILIQEDNSQQPLILERHPNFLSLKKEELTGDTSTSLSRRNLRKLKPRKIQKLSAILKERSTPDHEHCSTPLEVRKSESWFIVDDRAYNLLR